MSKDCKTIYYEGGSMIVGCGSQPCRCNEISETFERVFGESRAEALAELEAELATLPPADYVPSGEEWWD